MKKVTKKVVTQPKKYKVDKKYRPLSSYVKNSGTVIFIIIVGVGLLVAVFDLNNFLRYTYGGENSNGSSGSAQFDQTTIDKLNRLNSSDKNTNTVSTAKNPFAQAD